MREGAAEQPEQKSSRSTTSTRSPCSARSRNVPMPLMPPPTTMTSKDPFWRILARSCGRGSVMFFQWQARCGDAVWLAIASGDECAEVAGQGFVDGCQFGGSEADAP